MSEPDYEAIVEQRDEKREQAWLERMDAQYGVHVPAGTSKPAGGSNSFSTTPSGIETGITDVGGGQFVAPSFLVGATFERYVTDMYRHALGLAPRPTFKEIDADERQKLLEKNRVRQAEILAYHYETMRNAPEALLPILDHHKPVFSSDTDTWPNCEGCDVSGWEGEQPDYPCSTYELAKEKS